MTADRQVTLDELCTRMGLSDEQRAAVERTGDVIPVQAGAGSGKTRVLVARILRYVLVDGIDLDSIVAITFTVKAAAELKERVRKSLIKFGRDDLLSEVDSAQITTIHGFCNSVLRRGAVERNLDPGYTVADDVELAHAQDSIARSLVSSLGDASPGLSLTPRERDAMMELIDRLGVDQLVNTLTTMHAFAGEHPGIDIRMGRTGIEGSLNAPGLAAVMERVYAAYEQALDRHKRREGIVSFTDMQQAVYSLRDTQADLLTLIRGQYLYVLIDEFQDTNELQRQIFMDVLAPECLFVVGDIQQSIYGFRQADVSVFADLIEEHGPERLSTNYRSDAAVIELVNDTYPALLEEHSPDHGMVEHFLRAAPNSDAGIDRPALELHLVNAGTHISRDGEAAVVASLMGEEAISPTMLMRSTSHARLFKQALTDAGLDAVDESSGNFWDRPEIVDLLTLLSVVRDGTDILSWLTLLRSPLVGLTWDDIAGIDAAVRDLRTVDGSLSRRDAWISAIGSSRDQRITTIGSLVDELRMLATEKSLALVVHAAVTGSLHDLISLDGDSGDQRYANLWKLIGLASQAMAGGVSTVEDFLDWCSLRSSFERKAYNARITNTWGTQESVSMMTIHASKGLEFPVVYLVDTGAMHPRQSEVVIPDEQGTLWFSKTMDATAPEMREAKELGRDKQQAEMLRLLYVAMTRAEERIVMTGSYTVKTTKKDGQRANIAGFAQWIVELCGYTPPISGSDSFDHPSLPIRIVVHDAQELETGDHASHPDFDAGELPDPQQLIDPAPISVSQDDRAGVLWRRHLELKDEDPSQGLRLHAALEGILADGPTADRMAVDAYTVLPGDERDIIDSFLSADHMTALQERSPAMEETFAVLVDGVVTQGRFDALVRDGSTWEITDFKTHLPVDPDDAYSLHQRQVDTYVYAALSGPAESVTLTLACITDPGIVHSWSYNADDVALDQLAAALRGA